MVVRDEIEAQFPDIHTQILSHKTIQRLAFGSQIGVLRNWQRGILQKTIDFLEINLDFLKTD